VVVQLVGSGLLLLAFLVAVGWTLTRIYPGSELVGRDNRTARWFLESRTPTWNTVSDVGSRLADTGTAVGLTVVAVLALRWWLGRWRESLVVLAAISGELFVFLLVTNTVDRPRPPVSRLDEAPPTSSFPSGHTAAAIALYGVLAVIVLRRWGNRPAARAVAVLFLCVPVVVATARMYRGMHYPSDVLFGFVGGGLWLLAVLFLLMPPTMYGRQRVPSRRAR
jgi:undecaprenyl-diphosphatase